MYYCVLIDHRYILSLDLETMLDLQSGLGREHSKYGISEFLDVKFVSMGLGYSGANDS